MEPGHYDTFASDYATDNERNLVNSYYERPAMLTLLGDVRGARVLDAGCGAGPLAAELAARGATLAGFDASSRPVNGDIYRGSAARNCKAARRIMTGHVPDARR